MDFFYRIKQGVLILSVLGVYAFSSIAMAQTLEEKRLASKQKLNYLNDVTVDSNPQPLDAIDNSSGVTYTLGVKYAPESIKRSNVWVLGRMSKRFNGEEILGLLDTIVRFEKNFATPVLGFAPRLRFDLILPTNEFVHEQTSFYGATSMQLRLGRSLTPKLYMLLINTLRWNYHQYRISEIGSANIQNTLSSYVVFAYSVAPKTQVGLETGWSWAKTYENNIRNNYLLGGFASYMFTPEWSSTIGISTFASPMTADGQSSNLRVFNERFSTMYFSVTHFM